MARAKLNEDYWLLKRILKEGQERLGKEVEEATGIKIRLSSHYQVETDTREEPKRTEESWTADVEIGKSLKVGDDPQPSTSKGSKARCEEPTKLDLDSTDSDEEEELTEEEMARRIPNQPGFQLKLSFYNGYIMLPEEAWPMAKRLKRSGTESDKACFVCHDKLEGQTITCNGINCPIRLFHFYCVDGDFDDADEGALWDFFCAWCTEARDKELVPTKLVPCQVNLNRE